MGARRNHIPLSEQLAAALACLLPQEQRDALRRAKVPAQDVIRLFSPDHIGLHCFGEPDRDKWHNLTPILRPEHREKSKRDTSIAAKVKRIIDSESVGWRKFYEATNGAIALVETMNRCAKQPRPKRKIAARKNPWPPRGSRPMRGRKLANGRPIG